MPFNFLQQFPAHSIVHWAIESYNGLPIRDMTGASHVAEVSFEPYAAYGMINFTHEWGHTWIMPHPFYGSPRVLVLDGIMGNTYSGHTPLIDPLDPDETIVESNETDNSVTVPLCSEFDGDGDGLTGCQGDCNDSSASVWSRPGEASDLAAIDSTFWVWSATAAPGATVVSYDLLRAVIPGGFATSATCVESDDASDLTAQDAENPPFAGVFYYLVRAENACRGEAGIGPLGDSSSGVPRVGRPCP